MTTKAMNEKLALTVLLHQWVACLVQRSCGHQVAYAAGIVNTPVEYSPEQGCASRSTSERTYSPANALVGVAIAACYKCSISLISTIKISCFLQACTAAELELMIATRACARLLEFQTATKTYARSMFVKKACEMSAPDCCGHACAMHALRLWAHFHTAALPG